MQNRVLGCAVMTAAMIAIAGCGGGDDGAAPQAETGAAPAVAAQASVGSPAAPAIDAHLRKLYAGYAADTPPSLFDPETADTWLSPTFARLVKDAVARKEGTDWPLDADPVIRAQDYGDVSVLAVDTTETGPDAATSKVRFKSFGAEQTTTFKMTRTGDRWLIDDIVRPEYEEKSLKAAFSTAAPPG